jgi:TonB family protein
VTGNSAEERNPGNAPPPVPFRLRLRMLFEAGSERIDFSHPAARALLVALALAAVAAIAAGIWFAYLDSRAVRVNYSDLRRAYVERAREKIQVAADAAADERSRMGNARALKLRVVVNPNGGLMSAHVIESSGNSAVDDLTLRIVRESAPFEPFPDLMRRYTTSVEIYGTFSFK